MAAVLICGLQTPAAADSRAIGFENPPYVTGSINAQDGWGGSAIPINPSIDQAVTNAAAHSGSQSFRMSSFYTNGSFGDWVFSPSLTNAAGESGAILGGYAGGVLQPRFTSMLFFKSVTATAQDSHVTVSADRGDGARMSWIQVSDHVVNPQICIGGSDWGNPCTVPADCTAPGVCTPDGRQGLSVAFYDYRAPANLNDCDGGPTSADSENKCFVFQVLATNLDRSSWHRLNCEMEFYDGEANDVVRVNVDGGPAVRGTSWEDYFRNNQNPPFTDAPPVDSLLFQSRGTAEGNAGEGFLFDDVSYSSTACFGATRYVATTGNDSYNDCRDNGTPCKTVQHAVDVACAGDTVNVAAGVYTEQVAITKSLTVTGAGASATTIKAPATLAGDSNGNKNIVTVSGSGVNVDFSGFNVSGPGPSGCGSLHYGIFVRDAANANIHDNKVSDIRDQPLSGCQNGIGIGAGRAAFSTTGTATLTNNVISGYQKGGIVISNSGSGATINGNTVTGVGATPLIAQNGIQISSGAAATLNGNTVSGNECNHPSCGPDPVNDTQSTGILLLDAGATSVSGSSISNNDIGIYNLTSGATNTISGNTLSGNRYEGIVLDQGDATVRSNQISGGNIGLLAVSFGGNTENSTGTLLCNSITGAGVGIKLIDDSLSDAFVPSVVAHNGAITGNGSGIVNTTSAAMDATNNYWGCGHAANDPGCDTTSGNVNATPFLASLPTCVSCTTNSDCDDGFLCNGQETCDLTTGLCEPGTPLPDADGDGVCNLIDNCPIVFNPGQSETGGAGDVCAAGGSFTPTVGLSLKHVCLFSNVGKGRSLGVIKLKALIDEQQLAAPVSSLLTGGATVGITGGGLSEVEKIVFPAPRCVQQGGRRFKCIGTLAEVATFQRKGKTTVWTLRLNAYHRSFAGPLTSDPFDVVVTIGQLDRGDTINCSLFQSGFTSKCRK